MSNPFKSLEKKIKRSIEKLGGDIKWQINKLGDDVKGGVKWTGEQAEKHLKEAGAHAESTLRSTFEELEDELEEAGEQAFELAKKEATEAAQAAMKEISKGALNKAVDTIQIVAPTSIDLKLGPIGLSIGNLTERVDTLQKWASNPPSGREHVRAIIEEVAPTSVSIELSISLAFLLVQTDSLEFGVTSTYETADFLDKMDAILDNFGINI